MRPIGYGGCLLRSSQYTGTGAASGEGQSSNPNLIRYQISDIRMIMTHSVKKEKLIVFIQIRKKSNELTSALPCLEGIEGR
jgi:hypothetical protein